MLFRSCKQLFKYAAKRFIVLLAKITGFKSACFILATILLYKKVIDQNIWLYTMITVVCNTSGLRIADLTRQHSV